jgi:DNA-directed RNA polymerase specialized sigma24 family protein
MSHVLANLESEWRRVARCSAGRRALLRWGAAHPVLRGAGDLGELLERRRAAAGAPAILAALAVLARTDELAARTLLQALLPGLVRLARTAGHDDREAIDEFVSLAWERIRTYPVGRPGPVAGNILLDVRKRYHEHRRRTAVRAGPVVWVGDLTAAVGLSRNVRPAEDEALDRLGMGQWLVRYRAVVGERGWRAVMRTRVLGLSLAELAAEENTTVNVVGQRRWRALRQMDELPLAG